MTQVSKYPIQKATYNRIFEIFIKTLINISTKTEAKGLLSDFLTPTERIMLAKRLSIALMLEQGYKYKTIQSVLKVSAPTIAHINTARQYGNNGYKRYIDKILREESIRNFLIELADKLVSLPASGTKGASAWKQIKSNIQRTKKDNPF